MPAGAGRRDAVAAGRPQPWQPRAPARWARLGTGWALSAYAITPPPPSVAAAVAAPCSLTPRAPCPRAGEKLALDDLGPLIVRPDGSLRRIANWQALSDVERATALRRLAKRNRERLATLEEQQQLLQQQEEQQAEL